VIKKVFENLEQNIEYCFNLRGPSGESIVDVDTGGTELEPYFKKGSWASCTESQ